MTRYKHPTILISKGEKFNSSFTESMWRDRVFQKTKNSQKKMPLVPRP